MRNDLIGNKKPDTIRCFFAINPPKAIQDLLLEITLPLHKNKLLKNSKWTQAENLHITLRFLGNISETTINEIIRQAEHEINAFPQFAVTLTELHWFPENKPHMIVTIPEPLDTISHLEAITSKHATACGVSRESRAYLPHITLCRLHADEQPALPKMRPPINFIVDEVILLRSDPDPITHSSKYTPLKRFALQHNKK
jgi:2'-5' RNA ligase